MGINDGLIYNINYEKENNYKSSTKNNSRTLILVFIYMLDLYNFQLR